MSIFGILGRYIYHFLIIVGLMLISSCSIFQRGAIGTSSPIFYKASFEVETESNWEIFKKATPANLKLMEGLLHIREKDKNLLVSLTKGYAGYAFAVNETLFLEDYLLGKQDSPNKEQALINYSKSIDYGVRYLETRGVDYEQLKKTVREEGGIPDYLDSNLSSSRDHDIEAVLFTAQSLAAFINFNRTDMILVAELPVAKGMFDWVCEHRPQINFGACDIFYGAYEAGRPAMLGGNPEKGKNHFLEVIEREPHNWLAQVSYMQYYLIPMDKKEEFYERIENLKKYEESFVQNQKWHPSKETEEAFDQSSLAIFQAMAIERYRIIKENLDELF